MTDEVNVHLSSEVVRRVDPFEAFFREHESIRPRLREFERALDAAMNRSRAEAGELGAFQETLEFLRDDVLDHMRKEDEALLPLLEAKVGRFGTLVNVIAYDHDEVRRTVDKLGEAIDALAAKASGPHVAELQEVNRHGIFLVQYLSLHMAKEDSSLADLAREALGPNGLAEVARRLEGGA